jgi:hypothetical protein
MATINVTDEYRIKSDYYSWQVQKLHGEDTRVGRRKGKKIWKGVSYHATLQQAVAALSSQWLRESEAEGIEEIAREMTRIEEGLKAAVELTGVR